MNTILAFFIVVVPMVFSISKKAVDKRREFYDRPKFIKAWTEELKLGKDVTWSKN